MKRCNLIIRTPEFQAALSAVNEAEKNRIFCCHGLEHLLDVARISCIIALRNKLEIEEDIIYAAALLHDIGRFEQYRSGTPHEKASAELARLILPECGYNFEETELIADAILSHQSRFERIDSLGALLAEADDRSRQCYACNAVEQCYWSNERKNMEIKY